MKADYFWIIAVVVIAVIAILWKPIVGTFADVSAKATNQEKYEAGKAVFYDTERWGGGTYKSCAMCHAEDFVPDPNRTIDMADYVEGQPYVLKGITKKYKSGVMGTGDELFKQMNKCISHGDRMALGSFSRKAKFMDDLMFYVSKQ